MYRLFCLALFILGSLSAFSQIDTISFSQKQCNKRWRSLLFLKNNQMIPEREFDKRASDLNKSCERGFIAFDAQDTLPSKRHEAKKSLVQLGRESSTFLTIGTSFVASGGIMMIVGSKAELNSPSDRDAVFYSGLGIMSVGVLVDLIGIGKRLRYINKKNEVIIEAGFKNGLGASFFF